MIKYLANLKGDKRGITLLETIVALSVMTVAVTAIVGTVMYSYNSYGMTSNRLVALGLAREGVEVIRNMRDSNWLPPNHIDFCGDAGQPGYIDGDQYCYKEWLTGLENCVTGCKIDFNAAANTWEILNQNASYGLYQNPTSLSYSNLSDGSSPVYFRKLRIVKNTTSGAFSNDNPELQVISTVAWQGKGCGAFLSDDPDNAASQCKVVVEDRLTNWKDF